MWDSTYYGEDYDARLEQPGWATVGFSSSAWKPAQVQTVWPVDDTTRATPMGPPFMSSQMMQPIKAVRTIKPISMIKVPMPVPPSASVFVGQEDVKGRRKVHPKRGGAGSDSGGGNATAASEPSGGGFAYVYDFAQEFAGVVRLTLPAHTAAGTNISLMYVITSSGQYGTRVCSYQLEYMLTKLLTHPRIGTPRHLRTRGWQPATRTMAAVATSMMAGST